MSRSLTMFLLSFAGALALPFIELLNRPHRAIPTITVLGIVNLYSAYQLMRFPASRN